MLSKHRLSTEHCNLHVQQNTTTCRCHDTIQPLPSKHRLSTRILQLILWTFCQQHRIFPPCILRQCLLKINLSDRIEKHWKRMTPCIQRWNPVFTGTPHTTNRGSLWESLNGLSCDGDHYSSSIWFLFQYTTWSLFQSHPLELCSTIITVYSKITKQITFFCTVFYQKRM